MKNAPTHRLGLTLKPTAAHSREEGIVLLQLHPFVSCIRKDPNLLAAALRLAAQPRIKVSAKEIPNPAYGVSLNGYCEAAVLQRNYPKIRCFDLTLIFQDKPQLEEWSGNAQQFFFLEKLMALLTRPGDRWAWSYRLPNHQPSSPGNYILGYDKLSCHDSSQV